MIKKIISGGQTGADQAALDSAIKFNIPHGGWVPRGRKTEKGVLDKKYRMTEMPSEKYPARTRRNILDSEGTVVIARGRLAGGSLLTRNLAEKIGRPCCCIDLLTVDEFEAAMVLNAFTVENKIEVLNAAGPRLSSDAGIYRDVRAVMEAFIYMNLLEAIGEIEKIKFLPSNEEMKRFPSTLDEAAGMLASQLTLKTKTYIAHMKDDSIALLYFDMADYIRTMTGLYTGNQRLVNSLSREDKVRFPQTEDLIMDIVKRLKKGLEKEHILRVVP